MACAGEQLIVLQSFEARPALGEQCDSETPDFPKDKEQGEKELGTAGLLVIAFLCCVMGATDGLSLGALVFPSSHEYPNTSFKKMGASSEPAVSAMRAFVIG